MNQSVENLQLDKIAVRDIIKSCIENTQYTSIEVNDITRDEESAALAYTKLKHLYKEFT